MSFGHLSKSFTSFYQLLLIQLRLKMDQQSSLTWWTSRTVSLSCHQQKTALLEITTWPSNWPERYLPMSETIIFQTWRLRRTNCWKFIKIDSEINKKRNKTRISVFNALRRRTSVYRFTNILLFRWLPFLSRCGFWRS